MKRILFLFAGLVALSTTASATTNTTLEAEASITNYVRGYGNSFIFNENGIEFSVFADGQFDFYLPNHGPDVHVGINRPRFRLSFNSGYDYNPYVQYDGFGAIIQIENTPIYYDYYGRVNQVGSIFINYNGNGRINSVGGLNVYYRNNVFYRYDGFINNYNRSYVYKPWHRFYAVPHANHCVVNVSPYRQYYAPARHIYYRPYTNNVRYFNANGRRGNTQYGRRHNSYQNTNRYAQSPRNNRERSIQRRVTRNNTAIARTRATRTSTTNRAATNYTRNTNSARVANTTRRANVNVSTRNNTSRSNTARRTNTRVTKPNRNVRQNVTKPRNVVSNKKQRRTTTQVFKPRVKNSRLQTTKKKSVSKNRRKPSSKMTRSNTSRSSNQTTTKYSSRRSRT